MLRLKRTSKQKRPVGDQADAAGEPATKRFDATLKRGEGAFIVGSRTTLSATHKGLPSSRY